MNGNLAVHRITNSAASCPVKAVEWQFIIVAWAMRITMNGAH